MRIIDRVAALLHSDRHTEVPATFKGELERQCRMIIIPTSILAIFSWLPYLEADQNLYGQMSPLTFLRLGFSLIGVITLLLSIFPFFKRRSYHLLYVVFIYLELSAAMILAFVAADPVYMGGFCVTLLILPMIPLLKKHSYLLLLASVTLFFLLGINQKMSFAGWGAKYGLYNYIVSIITTAVAIYFLDSIRRRNFQTRLLIQARNEELIQTTMEVSQINQELESSSILLSCTNAELQRANEIKSDLLGMAAHDLKNPLQVISGYTELLQFKMKSNPDVLDKLKMIHSSTDKMLKLITCLLETASITGGKLTIKERPVNLTELVQSVHHFNCPLAGKKGQVIDLVAEPGCMIAGDPLLIQEVMDNLFSNAIKFSPPGKTIWVQLYREGSLVIFKVRDEGPGFTRDDHEKIFRKYQKLSAQPTGGETSNGLGLSIIRDLVELHRGTIVVDSESGQGSTFTIQFPAER